MNTPRPCASASTSSQHTCTTQQTSAASLRELAELARIMRHTMAIVEDVVHVAGGIDDLCLSHWLVLVHLLDLPICKQVDLRNATGIGPAYLSKLLDELVSLGLLYRDPSPTDRRQVLLTSTMVGKEFTRLFLTALRERVTPTQHSQTIALCASIDQWLASVRDPAV